jgi:CheY-like chemotaxis protein
VIEPHQAKARGLIVEGPFVEVAVADDGRGMRPDQLARAFDPFFTTKERGHGRGLGLAMCASIVHRAGGFIAADSEPLRGTTFRVHLPAAKSGAPEIWRQAEQAGTGGASGVKTVLLVADSESIRNLIMSVLVGRGVEVIVAADLRRARGVLAQRSVDVLLTEGTLPDGDGEELAREGLERRQLRRAILISGAPRDAESNLFHAVIPKPFRVDAVIETVLGQLPPFWTGG